MTIDVCKIYGPDAVFLQQAAHLTGGSYIYLERKDALLQHLLVSSTRNVNMITGIQSAIDDLPTSAIHEKRHRGPHTGQDRFSRSVLLPQDRR